jgi:Tol biopolymer transport system component
VASIIPSTSPLPLQPGTRLGPYEIVSPLGVGGMGEVYRATDTNLKRTVAVKVLPESVAGDADRLARFQREAEVLASLNHPNIAHIHGLEKSAGATALVMELVEGPTLADRFAQGAIPVSEALPIAKQIAEALEAAHEQGIINRDLKPANIKVREDGTVKVLDFGLAKAMEPTGVALPSVSQPPTITTPVMTQAGMILGTAAYMSPEQARGATVDKRADLWAFGVVLWEMLTGMRLFEGATVSDTLASVLKSEPEWQALAQTTPSAVRRLLRRCLEKDRKRRLDSAAAARLEIEEALTSPATIVGVVPSAARRTRWTTAGIAVLSAITAVVVTVVVLRLRLPEQASRGGSVARLELNLPSGVDLYFNAQAVAFSADGTRVAFVGMVGGVRQLYIRRLDQFEPAVVRGTLGASACFFSPDGRAVGFIVPGGGLKTVSLADGLIVTLVADADYYAGGAWGTDDRITFGRADALSQISATGGAVTPLTQLNRGKGELAHRWPTVVADGKIVLFTVVTGSARAAAHIEALTLATGTRQILVDPGIVPLYAPSGHLIFFRDDALLAEAFGVTPLAVIGPSIRVLDDVAVDGSGVPVAALSQAGTLGYASRGQATSQMVRVSRQGLEQPMTDTPRRYVTPRLAPDGQNVVVTANGDLWLLGLARPTFTKLTTNETAGNGYAVWTPDGRVIFRTQTGMHWIDASGSGRSGAIPGTFANDYPNSVSPDGGTLAFIRIAADTSADVYALSLKGEPQPRAIVRSTAFEGGPQFSPDGRWLAYVSDESGAFQVYLRTFSGPSPGRRLAVSTLGGLQPRWNRNGKELFYRNGNKMMVVDVSTSPELVLSPPRQLFEQRYAFGPSVTTPNYDVTPDGESFVMVKDESGSGRLNVVLNWFDELTRLVAKR